MPTAKDRGKSTSAASGAQIKELESRLVQLQETIDDLRELRQQAIEDLEKS